jgi:hypothetical protein
MQRSSAARMRMHLNLWSSHFRHRLIRFVIKENSRSHAHATARGGRARAMHAQLRCPTRLSCWASTHFQSSRWVPACAPHSCLCTVNWFPTDQLRIGARPISNTFQNDTCTARPSSESIIKIRINIQHYVSESNLSNACVTWRARRVTLFQNNLHGRYE